MFRVLLFVFALVFFFTGNTAWAQNDDGGGTNPPLGDADLGWCTVAPRVLPAGDSECGFASPSAACAFQVSTNYPDGRYFPTGGRQVSDTVADCSRRENLGYVGPELNIGIASVFKRCGSGFKRVGGTCQPIDRPASDTQCSVTGGSPESHKGNPINIITGAKRQSITDFATADGRMTVKRYYHSAPYGETEGLTASRQTLGYNWALSTHPVISLGRDFDFNAEFNLLMPSGFGFNYTATTANPQIFTTQRFYAGGGGLEYSAEFEDSMTYPAGKISRQIAVTNMTARFIIS